jgi:membrane-associated protein
LAALLSIPSHLGYAALAAFVGIETMGVPVPGETALIAAALLAADGDLSIELVILIAAAAAIFGDNVGFLIGRRYGRRLVEWDGGPYPEKRQELLERGQVFFDRHGGKAVFLGRWVAGLRITSAWLAGINRMAWPRFVFWNALGGIAWATSVGLAIYFLGHAAKGAVEGVGLGALGLGTALGVAYVVFLRLRSRRLAARGPQGQREPAEHEAEEDEAAGVVPPAARAAHGPQDRADD